MTARKRTATKFFDGAVKTSMTVGLLSFTAIIWGICELYGCQQERSYHGEVNNSSSNRDAVTVVALSIALSMVAFTSTALLLCANSEHDSESDDNACSKP